MNDRYPINNVKKNNTHLKSSLIGQSAADALTTINNNNFIITINKNYSGQGKVKVK